MPASTPPSEHVAIPMTPAKQRSGRLRFAKFTYTRTPAGMGSAEVVLELDRVEFKGKATGQSSAMGDVRISAEAALKALHSFGEGDYRFELLGVKHLRAFDTNLLIVSVLVQQSDRTVRVVGCALAEADIQRGTALAVLNATNRILGDRLETS